MVTPIYCENLCFGRSVKFSADGQVLAILGTVLDAKPACLIRVFTYFEKAIDSVQLGRDMTGDARDASLALGSMDLSEDGTTVVAGSGDDTRGHVRVLPFQANAKVWTRKGVDLDALISEKEGFVDAGSVPTISENGNLITLFGYASDETGSSIVTFWQSM